MTKQELIRSMSKAVNGADLMGLSDFMRWSNYSKTAACAKLKGLQHVPGTKKFYIPEIAEHLRILEIKRRN